MTLKYFSERLIAPCGMNCRICLGFFGYTVSGKIENLDNLLVLHWTRIIVIH